MAPLHAARNSLNEHEMRLKLSSPHMEFAIAKSALFLALLSCFTTVRSSVHVYNQDAFKEVGNSYLLSGGSEGIVASTNVEHGQIGSGIGDGHSFIRNIMYLKEINSTLKVFSTITAHDPPVTSRLHVYLCHSIVPALIQNNSNRFEGITFTRSAEAAAQHSSMEHSTGLVQAIIFEAADRDDIGGSAYGGQRSICCTPDLAKLVGCKQGEVLRRPSAVDPNWPFIINSQFSGTDLSTKMDSTYVNITKTGMYNLFFITCDPNLKGLVMSGKTLWKNPSGYLPGRMAPLMTFYVFMTLAYLLLSAIWFLQYVRFWRDILPLQNCITLVIVLGLFEMTLWYFEYLNFNITGIRPLGITTWVVTVGSVRKTLSRLLILSISMGYGVVRPTLGGLTSKVLLIGATYFVASESLDIAENVGTINDISGKARLFLVLPDAFLDAFLILWIFTSLSKTLEKLQAKRSTVKLDTYRKFTNALAVAVITSVAWIGYEVYFKATDPYSERWQSAWIVTAFWDILAFGLLFVICYLWAPSQSSQRYAYSDEVVDDDEEAQSLTKGMSGGDFALVKQERKEKGFDKADALGAGEALEEDKRE
ncbi:hypothetical protein ACLOJK_013851 [Asimina triloba]